MGENHMLRLTLAALAAATISFAYPALADDAMKADPMKATVCDDASMMKLQTEVDATTDAMMKDHAMKEMAMAKDAMTAKDDGKCVEHMDGAMKAMHPM